MNENINQNVYQNASAPAENVQPQPVPVPPAPVYYGYKPKEKKVYAPLDKKDFTFVLLYLLASFCMVCFGIFGGFHLGFTIAYIVLFAITTAYLCNKEAKPKLFPIICGVLSVAGSVTFALFSDSLINFIMLVLMLGLYSVYTLGLSASFNHKTGSYKMLLDLLSDYFSKPFKAIPAVIGGAKVSAGRNKRSFSALIGVLVSVPFIIIIGALLVRSDVAFESLVTKLFKNIGIYLAELLLAIVILPYLYSNSFAKRHRISKSDSITSDSKKGIPSSACISFLAMISVLYVVYLFSQLAYFFSAFKGILPADYHHTASAFARRGFFEMFAICAINIVLISIASAIGNKRTLAQKLLSCFISLFSVLLIITALQKMKLNVSIYGLSRNRLMVSVFMIMMLIVIAFFIIHIFAPKISYMQPIIVVCSAMFIALSFANIDARIPEYNIKQYEAGAIASVDIDNLANLGDSAVPYIVDLSSNSKSAVTRHKAAIKCAELMQDKYYEYFDPSIDAENKDFRHYNFAQAQAILSLDDAKNSEEISNLYSMMKKYPYDPDNDSFDVDTKDGWDTMKYSYKTNKYDRVIHNSYNE